MALTVADLLKKFKENKVSDDTYLLTNNPGGILSDSDIDETACVALAEMTVDKKDLSLYFKLNYGMEEEGKIKILVILLAHCNFNYYNCLTVGNFKNYAKNIKNKDEFVCVISPERLARKEGVGYMPILSAFPDDKDETERNDKEFRKIIGENIFHLYI